MFLPSPGRGNGPDRQADVAQLVAHHLAKVRVAGSNPVVRSERPPQVTCGASSVEWPRGEATACKAVYTGSNPVSTSAVRPRAIGAAGARFLDTEEVTGSIPVSPTSVCAGQRLVTEYSVTGFLRSGPYGGSRLGAQDHLLILLCTLPCPRNAFGPPWGARAAVQVWVTPLVGAGSRPAAGVGAVPSGLAGC